MPRKRQNRKKRYRKKQKKDISMTGDKEVVKTGQARTDSVIYRGIGIPAQFFTKLKYTHQYNFSIPYYERIMRMSSVYDPEFATGGGKPMYTDQLFALYQRYTVLACDIQMTFINKSATGESSYQRVGCYPLAFSDTASGIDEAIERDNCVYSTLGPNTGDQGIINMSLYGKINKIIGADNTEKFDDDYSGSVLSSPTRGCYAHIFCGSLDGITNSNVYMTVTMTYYVKFYSKESPARS